MEVALILVGLVAIATAGYALFLRSRSQSLGPNDLDRLASSLRAEIGEAQAGALRGNSEQFLALAEERLKVEAARGEEQLKARQGEIDRSLQAVGESLRQVTDFVQSVDRQRQDSISKLAAVTQDSHRALESLTQTTGRLDRALAGGQMRGQWGERMAEDVLRLAGFIEGVNYRRNEQTPSGTRPDFTFFLPQDRVLHMDVKFPLAGYQRLLEAPSAGERERATRQFLSDVRQRIREVTTRDYIDPASGTLDYMLVFIPNEQVYGFIHEQDAAVLDDALIQRVVLCSPLTLFAVLAVIRQSVDNFQLSEQTDRILSALGAFAKQWGMYQEAVGKVGSRLQSTQRAYEQLSGPRTNQLQRQIERVEQLRVEAGVEPDAPPLRDQALSADADDAAGDEQELSIPAEYLRR